MTDIRITGSGLINIHPEIALFRVERLGISFKRSGKPGIHAG
jgi:hypothetical protein